MSGIDITDQNFETEVLQSKIPVLVDFWADWCIAPDSVVYTNTMQPLRANQIIQGEALIGFDAKAKRGIVKHSSTTTNGGHCQKVTTILDRTIKVTNNHLFYSKRGWVKAEELKENDWVAVLPVNYTLKQVESQKTIVNESTLRRNAHKKMRVETYVRELNEKGILPLKVNNHQTLILARMVGALFTDGNLYEDTNNYREISFILGQQHDVDNLVSDLNKLGFSKIHTSFRTSKGTIGGREFINKSYRVKCLSTALFLLFKALGVPVGNKTNQPYTLPSWIKNAPLTIKREFLAGFLGGDGPKLSMYLVKRKAKRPYNHLSINDIEFHKQQEFAQNGIQFAHDLAVLFKEFGVRVTRVFNEQEQNPRKNGEFTKVIHIRFSHDFNSGFALAQKIGYAYSWQKQKAALYVGEFLQTILVKRNKWQNLYKRVMQLAKQGLGYRRISKKLAIAPLLAFNWIKGKDKATVAKHFLKFPQWLADVTQDLADGFVWEPISRVEEIFLPAVQRISVSSTHNFVANGFLVHNCGPCKMLASIIDELATVYQGKVKVTKLNVDSNQASAQKYGILSIPTVILFKAGQPVAQLVGVQPKEKVEEEIKQVLSQHLAFKK